MKVWIVEFRKPRGTVWRPLGGFIYRYKPLRHEREQEGIDGKVRRISCYERVQP